MIFDEVGQGEVFWQRIQKAGRTRLFTRNCYDISQRHRHIITAMDGLPAERLVLDGELVVLDDDGRSNFAQLAHGRMGSHYYAFDILMLGSDDLRGLRLSERKRILKMLAIECDPVRYTDHVVGSGKEFFELVKQAGLEGMVAKRRLSKYSGTLTDDWLKVKCLRTHEDRALSRCRGDAPHRWRGPAAQGAKRPSSVRGATLA